MRTALVWVVALVPLTAAPFVVADDGDDGPKVDKRVHDKEGRLVWEHGHMGKKSELRFATHYLSDPKKEAEVLADCSSTAYRLAPWHWTTPYSAKTTAYSAQFDQAAQTWDAATGADIVGFVSSGRVGAAGVQDWKNQIEFVDFGATGTIAVTTTWYYPSTGRAVESDAKFNAHYAWAYDGRSTAMDVLNIATHEIGHTLGLSHAQGSYTSISCLTMYAYASLGEVQKRSLGDGDVSGIRAIYGP